MELEFFASCLPGLEQTLAQELKSFGIERVRPLGGGAAFFCEADAALRACLWSRLASRIMLVVGRVNAGDAELLYAGVYDIAWEDVLADGATMAVRAHGANDELRNTRFTALKVKDAIADRMRAQRGVRPEVDTVAPRASVDVRIRDRRATVSLDFSGEALSRRAYLASDDKEDAALACSLAAGALALGGWDELVRKGAFFVDPACSDGIVLVEAALMACDGAPGLLRKKWGFQGWVNYEDDVWQKLHAEACERFAAGLARLGATPPDRIAESELIKQPLPDPDRIHFLGTTTSSPLITRARNHVRHAGLRSVVSVEQASAADIAQVVGEHKALSRAHVQMVASNLDALSRADAPALVQADEAAFAAAAALAREGSRYVAIGAQDVASRFGAEPLMRQSVGVVSRCLSRCSTCAPPVCGSSRFPICRAAHRRASRCSKRHPSSLQLVCARCSRSAANGPSAKAYRATASMTLICRTMLWPLTGIPVQAMRAVTITCISRNTHLPHRSTPTRRAAVSKTCSR